MKGLTISRTPSATTSESARRGATARAILLSPDFLIGVPAGLTLGMLPAAIPSLVENAFGFMIALSAISAGVAALVLTPMTMLLSALTPELRALLTKVPGGAAGTFVPFAQVALIAAGGCAASLIVAILSPLAHGTFAWVIWVGSGVPMALFLWALIGCVQVTSFLIGLFRTAQDIELLEKRREQAIADREKRAAPADLTG